MGLFKRKDNQIEKETSEVAVTTSTPSTYDELLQAEARRLHLAAMTLSPNEEQKAKDTQKLGEIKLESINASIRRIHKLKQLLRAYKEVTENMNEHSSRLYEANKQLAVNKSKEDELERFETLENIQGLYQRICLLEAMSRENKQAQSQKSDEVEQYRQKADEEQKLMTQRTNELQESTQRLKVAIEHLEQAYRILGARAILDLDIQAVQDIVAGMTQKRDALALEIGERKEENKKLQELSDKKKLQRQAMEPHRKMLTQGQRLLFCLDILSETKTEIEQIDAQYEECTQKQREESNMLERTFSEYQKVEADILTLTSELQRHRASIAGTDSYELQERAMQQKTYRQMLLSAQALWAHIQQGYGDIDENEQELIQLRNKIEYGKQSLSVLGQEVNNLRQECKSREYTLTVSKSQNVIQLRSDLREGVNCTVCGATHHPYHSDTMLEQNKLISELRSEYELQLTELQTKEKRLHELILSQAKLEAQEEIKSVGLVTLKKQQDTFVKEWGMYKGLDRSFADCSPSTNLEARTGMIRQLIENATHDADNAQHELDTYNYHQTRINEITEKLAHKNREKGELTVRLNEENTGCQVLTRQAKQLEDIRANLQTRYSRLYEEANKTISLPEWFKDWQNNTEGLKQHIEEMTQSWNTLHEELVQLESRQQVSTATLEGCMKQETMLENLIQQAQKDIEQRVNLRKEGEKNYERTLEDQKAEDYAETEFQLYASSNTAEKKQREVLQNATSKLANAQGQQAELSDIGHQLDEQASAGRLELDLWIRQYNAYHPSVQYKDLEQYFAGKTDWNQLRKQLRETRIEADTEQRIIDVMRDRVLEIQALASQSSADINTLNSEELDAQLTQLEQQYREACLEIAEQILVLQRNERCKKQVN